MRKSTSNALLILDVLIWALSLYIVTLPFLYDEGAKARRSWHAMRFWGECAVWCGRRAMAAELRYRELVQS